MNSPGTSAAADEAVSPRPVVLGSLVWALAVPVALTFTGWLAQYPYGMVVIAVIVALAVVAVAAIVAGSVWHRAGAATVAAVGGFALVLFAGPGLYQLYMESWAGRRADPLGLLDPRLPSSPGGTTLTTTLMVSVALFALTGGAMGYAGPRRR